MRLNNVQRNRIISIFDQPKYYASINKYQVVSDAASKENIFITPRRLRDLINKYKTAGLNKDRVRKNSAILISKMGLLALNKFLIKKAS